LTDPPNGAEIMPPLEAEAMPPGGEVVDLGPLTPDERTQLENEVDGPTGAPQAGLGGASSGGSGGVSADWIAAGGAFLIVAGLANLVFRRRRRNL
jgi:hypothetical protein